MRTPHLSSALLSTARCAGAGGLALLLLAAAPSAAADLALKRVMLSAGGVGYFEYEARVEGDQVVELTVRRDQVDDVLKSIVIYDDKGGIGDISLPGEDPLRDVFRELPFDQAALRSPADLLNALRGAEVEIGGAAAMRGRIIAVTTEAQFVPPGGQVAEQRLSIMTADGIRSVRLGEAGPIAFVDAKLKAQVQTALDALMQNRTRERRTLQVRTTGRGARTLRVAYVVEAPLWKAAYRLTVGGADAKSAALQGWAVLENRSGEDWTGVELTLASGNPVTFRQQLYAAYYVNRPQVPVEVFGRVLPSPDKGAVATGAMAAAAAPRAQAAAPTGGPGQPVRLSAQQTVESAPKRAAELIAAEASEAATQAVYTLPGTVTLANGHSLLVPLVARDVPAERLLHYQPATHERHPLAAVRLTNDSGVALPPGILTLYERGAGGEIAFVGDARLNPLPAGEQRLVDYALDQNVVVQRRQEVSKALSQARLAEGLLTLSMVEQIRTAYVVNAADARAPRILIDHPRSARADLIEPQAGVERIEQGFRIALPLGDAKAAKLEVVEERRLFEQISLGEIRGEDVARFLALGKLTARQREGLQRLGELVQARGAAERKVARLTEQRTQLEAEQARTRANLGAVPQQSDLQRRYLDQLGEQEDRLGKLAAELDAARQAEAAARESVAAHIRGLNI